MKHGPGDAWKLDAPLGSALAWGLSRILPSASATDLLRVILTRGPDSPRAWERYRAAIPDHQREFRTDTGWRKRLSPLLLAALREQELDADAGLLTVLRTAYVREELRSRIYREILREVLEVLQETGSPFLVSRGAALAETCYPEPILRHAHDIDIVVAPEHQEPIVGALEASGLQRASAAESGNATSLMHRSGLPVLVHRTLFRNSYYTLDPEEVWSGTERASIMGLSVELPAPAHQLLHALGHASYSRSRSTLLWVTDSWMIMTREEPVDWALFCSATRSAHLDIPIYSMVRYLAEALDAPVPAATLHELAAAAESAPPASRDVALLGARSRAREDGPPPGGRPRWRDRLIVAWWQLFPSPSYLGWAYGNAGPVRLVLIYASRPFSWAAEKLRWKVRAASERVSFRP